VFTEGGQVRRLGKDLIEDISGDHKAEIKGNKKTATFGNTDEITYGNKKSVTHGDTDESFTGNKKSTVVGSTNETFTGTKVSHNLAATEETFVGAKASQALAATSEIFVGAKQSACAAFELVTNASLKVEKSAGRVLNSPSWLEKVTGKHEEISGSYELTSLGPITLDAASDCDIKGAKINIDASGKVLIKGSEVKIQASNIKLDGEVEISKSLHVKGAEIKHKDQKVS